MWEDLYASPIFRVAALVLLSACGTCGGEPTEEEEEEASARPELFFPMHLGDRWGYADGGGVAVTALTESGVAVFFGSDRTSAERFTANEAGEILLVDPTDRPIATWLDTPMELGHSWEYTIGDTSCRATYATIDQDVSLPGMEIHGCVEVRRRCQLPEGKPFPAATLELHEETYCPYVGRMTEIVRFDPRPEIEGFPEEKRFEVAYYRIQDAVAVPEPDTFGCAHFLFMDTDIQAACGPMMRRDADATPQQPDQCTMRFRSGSGTVSVHATRLASDATDADVDERLAPGVEPPTEEDGWRARHVPGATGAFTDADGNLERRAMPDVRHLGLREGRFVVTVRVEDTACAEAASLQPLLRSLVRR